MGRKSTIAGLPDAIRAKLDALLLNRQVTIEGATCYVNEWLREHAAQHSQAGAWERAEGVEAAALPEPISKSAVGRYKLSLDEMTAEIAETDRLAALMLKELNITNQSNVAQATAETLRVMLMRFIPLLRQSMQSEAALSIKEMKDITGMLKDLTAGHERLENSATINEKRRREIQREAAQQAREQAATAVSEAATARGLDADFARFLRESVLQGGV